MAENREYARSVVRRKPGLTRANTVPPNKTCRSFEDDLALEDMEVQINAMNASQVSNSRDLPDSHFHSLLQQIGDEYDRVVSDLSGQRSATHISRQAPRPSKKAVYDSGSAPQNKTQIPKGLADPVSPNELASSSGPAVIFRNSELRTKSRSLEESNGEGVPFRMGTEGLVESPKLTNSASQPTIVKQISETPSSRASDPMGPLLSEPPSPAALGGKPCWGSDSPMHSPSSLSFPPDSPIQSRSAIYCPAEETSLDLHPRWDKQKIRKFSSRGERTHDTIDFATEGEADDEPKTVSASYNGALSCCVGLPSSPKRVAWDMLGMVTIMYELFLTPMRVFDPPENIFTDLMDWFALVFWFSDMFVRITTAYSQNGSYEMNPMKIAQHYFKFWFWIDFVVVIPDLAFTIAKHTQGNTSDAGSSVKLIRVLRLMRVIRLVRLAKLRWIIANLKDHIDSEHIDISFNVAKLLLALAAVSHFISCAWFSITLLDDVGTTWIEKYNLEAHKVGWLFQYTTAFRWSIAQFSPSSIPITAQNNVEQLFSIFVVFFGLVGFSYLVGSITGSLAELTRMTQACTQQFWQVRRFLKKSNVPIQLRIKIEKYLEHAWNVQKNSVNIGSTPILKLLTEQLRNELNLSMSMPHLEVHPLLAFLSTQCPYAMQRIATQALSRQTFARRECVFLPREMALHMSFVVAGRLKYSKKTEAGKPDHSEWVDKGEDWVTEPALWTSEWTTLGKLMAVSVTELLVVSSAQFADAIILTPQVFARVSTYAANFMRWINSHQAADLSDVLQGDKYSEHISYMLWDDGWKSEAPDCGESPAQSAGLSPAQSAEHMLPPLFGVLPELPVVQ